eukprot:RCo011805
MMKTFDRYNYLPGILVPAGGPALLGARQYLPYAALSPDDMPPFSRIFVSCPASLTKEALQAQFEVYGTIQNIRMVTDHTTGAFKGICFVKYDKASSAAAAVEQMNGQQLDATATPIKVTYADPKGAPRNSHDDGEVPPRSRLIATFSKNLTEEEVKARFAGFEDMESVKFLKVRQTSQNRGIAFVKFTRTSSALRAVETITEQEQTNPSQGQPMRVKIAEPRPPLFVGSPTPLDAYGYPHPHA